MQRVGDLSAREEIRDECDSDGAQIAIDNAAKKAGLSLDAVEFDQLIAGACERDEGVCRKLGRTAELLAPYLPGKSGRPISTETCIHLMLQRWLEHASVASAYTYSEIDGGDFVDPATQATRLAVNDPGFSPVYATRGRAKIRRAYRRSKTRIPVIIEVAC